MRLIDYVRDLEGLKPSEHFILLLLATYAKEDGTNIHPSVELIAKKTGYGERYIFMLLAKLQQKHLVADGLRGHVRQYKIPVEDLWPGYMDQLAAARTGAPRKVRLQPATPPVSEQVTQELPAITPKEESNNYISRLPGESMRDWIARANKERMQRA